MFKKTAKDYFVLERLSEQKGLWHAFSTRKMGDMRAEKSLDQSSNIGHFLSLFGKSKKDLVLMEQIHGNKVVIVGEKEKGKVVPKVDGLVCQKSGIILGVKSADCLPILFFDPQKKIIGVVHAGWQGTFKKIAQAVVKKMVSLDSKPEGILVGVGPHIGPCCYFVTQERADLFRKEFGGSKGIICEDDDKIFLDLKRVTVLQLIEVGILKSNIEDAEVCTSCQNKEFFSYRQDSQKTFGEILGVVSLTA